MTRASTSSVAAGPQRIRTWSLSQEAWVVDVTEALAAERSRALDGDAAAQWVRRHALERSQALEQSLVERRKLLWVRTYARPQGGGPIESIDLMDLLPAPEPQPLPPSSESESESEPEPELRPKVFRARLEGMLFDTNKTFLLPSAMHGIRGLKRYYDHHTGLAVLVTGHTDTVGGSTYNEALSQERAQAVAAYLVEDVGDWLERYGATPHATPWATPEDQAMLSVLPSADAPYYAGPLHGLNDGPTRAAVRAFQADAGVGVDGVAGPNTRRALIEQYMAIDETTLPDGVDLQTHGCGEHHPVVATTDGVEEARNRRVEVFLFEGEVDPPPRPACAGCPEYPQWLEKVVETVDFSDEPGWLDVAVFNDAGAPLLSARVEVDGAVLDARDTAQDGHVRFHSLPAGSYRVLVHALDHDDAEFEVAVFPGVAPAAAELAFVPSPDNSDDPPQDQKSSLSQPNGVSGGTASGGGQVGPNAATASLSNTDAIVHLVGQVPDDRSPPGVHQRVREGSLTMNHGIWGRMSVRCSWGNTWITKKFDAHGKAVFKLDPAGAKPGYAPGKQGVIQEVIAEMTDPGATEDVRYTLREPTGPETQLVRTSVESGKTRELKISTRLRNSLWAPTTHCTTSNLEGLVDLDDVSLLTTLSNGLFGPKHGKTDIHEFGVEWDSTFRYGANKNPTEVKFYEDIAALVHAKKSQILLGFQRAEGTGKTKNPKPTSHTESFWEWMFALHRVNDAERERAINAFADRLVGHHMKHLPTFEGISFDIEHIPSTFRIPIEAQAEFFTYFYRAVAIRLRVHRKFIAIAVGAFDNQLASVLETDLQKRFCHNTTLMFARAHPYQMAKGHANMILRPMAYGSVGPKGAPKKVSPQQLEPAQHQWHSDIVRYALSEVGLAPDQFQLGVTFGSGNAEVGLRNGQALPNRTTKLLRPNQVGIAGFALAKRQYWLGIKRVNDLLNPGEQSTGYAGQPLQCPVPT